MATRAGVKGVFVYVPDELQQRFKVKAAQVGKSQKQILLDFLEAYCEGVSVDDGKANRKTAA